MLGFLKDQFSIKKPLGPYYANRMPSSTPEKNGIFSPVYLYQMQHDLLNLRFSRSSIHANITENPWYDVTTIREIAKIWPIAEVSTSIVISFHFPISKLKKNWNYFTMVSNIKISKICKQESVGESALTYDT